MDHLHHHQNIYFSSQKRLWIALWINLGFLLIEIVGGIISGSLALLADAGHMLTDVAALILALFAARLSAKPYTPQKTFGYLRAEVLGAFINSASLFLICGFIIVEAIKRFGSQPEIDGPLMLVVAVAGLAANTVSAVVLAKHRHHSVNVKGAFLHMMADALGSVGAIVAGLVIWLWGWSPVDPIVSLIIVFLIVMSSWNLLKDTTNVLLEATPARIDYKTLKQDMIKPEQVEDVHDLHIWTIANDMISLSAHVVLKAGYENRENWSSILHTLERLLAEKYGIEHSTLQIEPCDFPGDHDRCNPAVDTSPGRPEK